MDAVTSILLAVLMFDVGMRLQEYREHLRSRRIGRNVMHEVRETEQWGRLMNDLHSDEQAEPCTREEMEVGQVE